MKKAILVVIMLAISLMAIAPLNSALEQKIAQNKYISNLESDLMDGLIGFWNFDFENDITKDSSGNNKHGTLLGNPQIIQGKVHTALEFDGVDDGITFGDDPYFDITGDLSIALWFRTDTAQFAPLVNKLDSGDPDNGYYLGFDTGFTWEPAGTISFKLARDSAGWAHGYDIFTTQNTYTDGDWHFLTAIYTPDGVSRPRVYIDNELTTGIFDGPALDSIGPSPGYEFKIAEYTTGGRYFDGAIDEIRMYNRELSLDEIEELYYQQAPNLPLIEGEDTGSISEPLELTISATDPNGHSMIYYWDWGDRSGLAWTSDPKESGETFDIRHNYNFRKQYTIKVMAKDELGTESGWETFEVTMPRIKSKSAYTSIVEFIENLLNFYWANVKVSELIKNR
jgi:hypothetical protein